MSSNIERVSVDGNPPVHGFLHRPQGEAPGGVVLTHGASASARIFASPTRRSTRRCCSNPRCRRKCQFAASDRAGEFVCRKKLDAVALRFAFQAKAPAWPAAWQRSRRSGRTAARCRSTEAIGERANIFWRPILWRATSHNANRRGCQCRRRSLDSFLSVASTREARAVAGGASIENSEAGAVCEWFERPVWVV